MANTPEQDRVIAGIAEIIEEVTGIEPSEVTMEKSFVDDLDIDSLSMVEIAVQTEDKYGVKIPDEDLASLRTVGDVVNYIQKLEDENPEDPDLFGLYHGVPLPERGDMSGLLPDKISIYRVPLEESFHDPEELREEIRITVLHELAHYFGLDEERIAELGYD